MDIAVHTCGAGPCQHDAADLGARLANIGPVENRPFTLDLHCHVLVPEVEACLATRPERIAEVEALARATGTASVLHNARQMLPAAAPRLTTLAKRLEDMDAIGIDVQAISPSPSQFHYWAEPELAADIVHRCNECIAELCARVPSRLVGLGSVALQHPDLAADQLQHAVTQLGLRGVEISSQAQGRDLDHPDFAPFWKKAEELDCLVFLHPFGTTLGERLNRYYLSNVIGQPLETTIALSHLIFGGVLDRHPGLRICAAHGGGYLPYYIGRSEQAFRVRPEAGSPRHPPSHYLRQVWFDSVVYDPATLRQLVDRVGASQVVAGTDYPFDMGSYRIHELLAAVPGLSALDRAGILGLNAARLLKFEPKRT
jgi:aminocarboxymuconate-semialdehyde decarboxylase